MRVLNKKNATFLILLSCLTYSTAYVGRLCYGANIVVIREYFGTTQSIAGIVSSFYFFSYAAGQLANSILSKYYNPKYVVTVSLIISSLCNLGLAISPDIAPMKYIWLINGIAQSTLWCNILNIQSKFLSSKDISRAIIWNCMTYSFGNLVCYGVSAGISALGLPWQIVFYFASALVFVVALIWFFGVRRTEYAFHHDGAILEEEPTVTPATTSAATITQPPKVKLFTKYFIFVLMFACVSAACAAFIRDGVVTWLPSILKNDFGVSDSISMILTMILPEISILGAFLVKWLKKHLKGHLFLEGLLYVVAALSIFAIILLYPQKNTVLTVFFFALMYLMICGIVNITTSIIPFSIRKYGNVGGISAFLDACCYVGAVCSTYGFGAIADHSGWMAVIRIAAITAILAAILAFVGAIFSRRTEITKEVL